MLDVKLIRTQPDAVRKGLQDRGGRYVPELEKFFPPPRPSRAATGG